MLTTSSDIATLYIWDGTGNPVGLLTDFSTNAFSYTYDPYGTRTLTAGGTGNGAGQNPYSFKSGIQDRASGLVKFGLRWYDATSGTWTQQDTLDSPLDPSNANRYAYAGGDPINASDPTGERQSAGYCKTVAAVGAGAGAVAAGAAAYGVATAPGNAIPVAGQVNTGGAVAVGVVSGAIAAGAGLLSVINC
nr:RHS repeat-associated core domain-containing protein [Frigoribacterium sp. CFBP 13707]